MNPFAYFALACAGLLVVGLIVALVQKIRGEDTEIGCGLSGCAVFIFFAVICFIAISDRGCVSTSGPGGGRGIPSGPPPGPPPMPRL